MDWVESKFIWGLRPELAEVFVRREAFEGLESSGEVVGSEEVGQVRFELVVGIVEVSLDGSVLDGSVHALDLSVGPAMAGTEAAADLILTNSSFTDLLGQQSLFRRAIPKFQILLQTSNLSGSAPDAKIVAYTGIAGTPRPSGICFHESSKEGQRGANESAF